MEKVWKDGRIKVELSDEEKAVVNTKKKLETPSNKDIMELLLLILDILSS